MAKGLFAMGDADHVGYGLVEEKLPEVGYGMLHGMVCTGLYLALVHCMLIISHLSFGTSEEHRDR